MLLINRQWPSIQREFVSLRNICSPAVQRSRLKPQEARVDRISLVLFLGYWLEITSLYILLNPDILRANKPISIIHNICLSCFLVLLLVLEESFVPNSATSLPYFLKCFNCCVCVPIAESLFFLVTLLESKRKSFYYGHWN